MTRPDIKHCTYERRGTLLIELMIALGVLTISFTAIFSLLNRSLALSRTIADNYTGTYLASEGIEIAKNILDANQLQGAAWNAGFQNGEFEVDYASFGPLNTFPNLNRFLRFDSTTKRYSYTGTLTTFKRKIVVALRGANEVQVNSIVTWTSRRTNFQVNLEDHFFNWRF